MTDVPVDDPVEAAPVAAPARPTVADAVDGLRGLAADLAAAESALQANEDERRTLIELVQRLTKEVAEAKSKLVLTALGS